MSHLDAPVAPAGAPAAPVPADPAADRPDAEGTPVGARVAVAGRSRPAVAAFVVGVVSLLLSTVPVAHAVPVGVGAVAVALSVVALRRLGPGVAGKGFAVAGVVLGSVSVAAAATLWVVLAVAVPPVDSDRLDAVPGGAGGASEGAVVPEEAAPEGAVAQPEAATEDAVVGEAAAPWIALGRTGSAPATGGGEQDVATSGPDTGSAAGDGAVVGLPIGGATGSPAGSPAGSPVGSPDGEPGAGETPSDAWCEVLDEEAVFRSQELAAEDESLVRIRGSVVVEDHRTDYAEQTDGEEILVLSCRGTGTWTDGTESPVLTRLMIGTDGELFVAYVAE